MAVSKMALLASALALLPALCRPQPPREPGTSQHLSLPAAEQIALRNHPQIGSATEMADAAKHVITQAKSAYYPTATVNVTGALANDATVLAAGSLTTSSLSSRFAVGVGLAQLVTDFGRTTGLAHVAELRYQAANDSVINVRAQVILGVRRAYFGVLGSEAVLRANQATLEARQLTLRQVSALAQSSLRSTLDVSFAQVLVSEAQLAVNQAENDVQSSRAVLAAAMGQESVQNMVLDDQPAAPAMDADLTGLLSEALMQRPDLRLLENTRDAAYRFAGAEKKLRYPTVNFLAAAGVIPEGDHTLPHDNYEAAAINVAIPVFNGGLFSARRAEAEARARAADKDVQNLSVSISRDVRTAWFNAQNAYRQLDVTSQLVNQARKTTHLAQARYDSGLGSIVELNQAQVSQISAEIGAAAAKYDYLSRRTELDFMTGSLR